MTSRTVPGNSRQERVTAACEECRRRKLRCDGREPQCGVCRDSGASCEYNTTRAPRGPKKGYFQELKERIAMLEERISEQQQAGFVQQTEASSESYALSNSVPDYTESQAFPETVNPGVVSLAAGNSPGSVSLAIDSPGLFNRRVVRSGFVSPGVFDPCSLMVEGEYSMELELPVSNPLIGESPLPKLSVMTNKIVISTWMHDELDQLYFDRLHIFIPILHQRQYLSWSKKNTKKTSCLCLQSAMWTLATLFSAQFQHLQEQLYKDTKVLLESLSAVDNEQLPLDTEQIQALVLVATYQSMRVSKQQAWLTAGKVFRMAQLMKLHEIDSPAMYTTNGKKPSTQSLLETEEQRRVFWMAYFLDTLLTIYNGLPVTMNEHLVFIRLPAPDIEFQSSRTVLGSFLSEAIVEQCPQNKSSFIECVILANICGRSLFYNQQYNSFMFYGGAPIDKSIQYQWLDNVLTTRLQILSQHYPSATETLDPILLFASTLGQVASMALCKMMESTQATRFDGDTFTMACQSRVLTAASQIVDIAKALTEFPYFKVHPLMPATFAFCIEYLYDNRLYYKSFDLHLKELADILRQLKDTGNSSQSYVDLLEFLETARTQALS